MATYCTARTSRNPREPGIGFGLRKFRPWDDLRGVRRNRILALGALLATLLATTMSLAAQPLASADFSTYSDGALVGQKGWSQFQTQTSFPLAVTNGRVAWPGGARTNNQDAMLAFSSPVFQPVSGTNVLFFDLVLRIDAPSSNSPSYFAALNSLTTTNTGGNFQNARLVTLATNTGFVFGARVNGQPGYSAAYGTNVLTVGQDYAVRAVINMVAGNANDTIELYVGPNFTELSLHATAGYSGSGSVNDPEFGAALLSQFGSVTADEPGVSIASLEVSLEQSGVQQQQTWFTANSEGESVLVRRWGTGAKSAIFFSHTGSLAGAFGSNALLVDSLASRGYSVFVWDYPTALRTRALNALGAWHANMLPVEGRPIFRGVASSMLAQIRAATGLENFVLIGNSLGAGVVLSDYDILVQEPRCQMLMISPTEPFIPPNLPPVLQKSSMVSDAFNDGFLRRQEEKEFCARNSNLPFPDSMAQPGHIVVGDATTIEYAFQLLDRVFAPRMVSASHSEDGRFSMSWTPASSVHVQRCLDLNEAAWATVLSNVTGTNYVDEATPIGRGFYRLILP